MAGGWSDDSLVVVETFRNLLIGRATGQPADDQEYRTLRRRLLTNPTIAAMLPRFVHTCLSVGDFWGYIKAEFKSYDERRAYLRQQFASVLEVLESGSSTSSTRLAEPAGAIPVAEDKQTDAFPSDSALSVGRPTGSVLTEGAARGLTPKPTVFIGSSSAGLRIARAVEVHLDHVAEVTLWSNGVFGLGDGTLEALVEALDKFDFAVLVLTGDDLTLRDGQEVQSPRDNVLFELGLFIGRLGRRRTFMLYNRDQRPRLPTDLAGVTAATFRDRADDNIRAAVSPACTMMMEAIEKLGRFERQEKNELDRVRAALALVQAELARTRREGADSTATVELFYTREFPMWWPEEGWYRVGVRNRGPVSATNVEAKLEKIEPVNPLPLNVLPAQLGHKDGLPGERCTLNPQDDAYFDVVREVPIPDDGEGISIISARTKRSLQLWTIPAQGQVFELDPDIDYEWTIRVTAANSREADTRRFRVRHPLGGVLEVTIIPDA